jgi:cytochrome P450
LLRVLASNPLEAWTAAHFEEPIVTTGLSIGRVAVVNEPAAIRRVLMTNTENYQKDWLQRRVLSAALENGLLTVDGDQWKFQRRALAPLFSPKTVLSFSAAMTEAAETLIDRLYNAKVRSSTSRTSRRASPWTCWSAPFFRTDSGAIRMKCAPRCRRISIQLGASIHSIF